MTKIRIGLSRYPKTFVGGSQVRINIANWLAAEGYSPAVIWASLKDIKPTWKRVVQYYNEAKAKGLGWKLYVWREIRGARRSQSNYRQNLPRKTGNPVLGLKKKPSAPLPEVRRVGLNRYVLEPSGTGNAQDVLATARVAWSLGLAGSAPIRQEPQQSGQPPANEAQRPQEPRQAVVAGVPNFNIWEDSWS